MVIIGNLQPFGQITPMGMKVLGVFVACIFGWITIDVLWISIFGFLAFSLTGYGSITQVIGAGLSNYTVILVLFASLLAGVIESTNCVEIINKWLLTKNIIHQKPMALVFANLPYRYFGYFLQCRFCCRLFIMDINSKYCRSVWLCSQKSGGIFSVVNGRYCSFDIR